MWIQVFLSVLLLCINDHLMGINVFVPPVDFELFSMLDLKYPYVWRRDKTICVDFNILHCLTVDICKPGFPLWPLGYILLQAWAHSILSVHVFGLRLSGYVFGIFPNSVFVQVSSSFCFQLIKHDFSFIQLNQSRNKMVGIS